MYTQQDTIYKVRKFCYSNGQMCSLVFICPRLLKSDLLDFSKEFFWQL